MQELFLHTLAAFFAITLAIGAGMALFKTLRVLFRTISFICTFLTSSSDPNPDAVTLYQGRVVEARNWHGSTDGVLYSEFWLRAEGGLERRYKLKGIHTNLRTGHRVILYEYAGTLVAINNRSTGTESWVAPEWLLSSLYPTGRFRRFIFGSLIIWGTYFLLTPSTSTFKELLLFLAWVSFTGLILTLMLRHVFSTNSRQSIRLSAFSAFCYQASKAP